jgi:hypothetical protein
MPLSHHDPAPNRQLAGLLALAFVAATASGCGRLEALAMIEERPVTLTSAPGCRTAPTAPRGWHYRAQLDLGERPDSSSASSSVSALTRTVRTTSIDPGISTGSVLMVVQVLVVVLAMLLGLFVIAAVSQKKWGRASVLAAVLGVLGIATIVLGYASGSVLTIDNATDVPVRVTVDGTTVEVPAGSMTELRVSGPNVAISTEASAMPGTPMEQLSLALDGNPVGTLMRLTFGDGRYIYAVCGANHYEMGHYSYH